MTASSRLAVAAAAAVAAVLASVVGGALCVALLASGSAGASCGEPEAVGSLSGKEVPGRLIPIYEEAAARYGLGPKGPAILAGINWEETGFGTNLGNSSAGAEGWMQFLPSSWQSFGVDANGDGIKDPDNPWDAIFAAARLLRYSGAPGDWPEAIYSYNHAKRYVEDVLADAKKFAGAASVEVSAEASGCEALGAPNERVARMVAEANRLSELRPTTTYIWGGSHGSTPTPPNGPFDCSSAVSHLLQVGGFDNETMETIGLSGWGRPGPGRWITILVKPYEPEAHTVIEFMPGVTPPGKRYWGTSGFVEPGHGPGWIGESVFSAGYLTRFEQRHPPGF